MNSGLTIVLSPQFVNLLLKLRDSRELRLKVPAVVLNLCVERLTGRMKLALKRVDDLGAFVQQLDHCVELGAPHIDRPGLSDATDLANALHAQDSFRRHATFGLRIILPLS